MELREQTIETNEVFSGRLVKLRVDRVRLPDGREATREVVVHRGAVAVVPMTDSGKVVLVRQYRQAAGEVLMEIPAGTLEPGENPADCAHREVQEEVGYRSDDLTLMFRSYLAPGYSTEMLHTFLARKLARASAERDADEFIEVVEAPIDQALRFIETGDIKDAKTICGILMAVRRLEC
jgi:ADP-ribose pyrophosphatase